jgi:hypothetical protein
MIRGTWEQRGDPVAQTEAVGAKMQKRLYHSGIIMYYVFRFLGGRYG